MGLIVLLRFSLVCIDFLAWPAIALGYPLFASIRAIETGSMYHMRKLVIYWTLFSIICLFEYVFVKVIEWMPFWSSIKLLAIFWLVIPRFHGACHAYQSFIHPHLVVNVQEAINRLDKLKVEQPRTKEIFLDVAEKYIQENGFKALENLIASEMELKEPDNSEADSLVIEQDVKNVATAPKLVNSTWIQMELKEPDNSEADSLVIEQNVKNVATAPKLLKKPGAALKDKEMFEAPEKIAATERKQQHARPVAGFWVPKGTTYAAAKTKDTITPTETTSEDKQPTTTTTPPSKKVHHQEWSCPLCEVTTSCESNLNDHLRGKTHKSMCEFLKRSKLDAQDAGPSSTGKKAEPEPGKDKVRRRISDKKLAKMPDYHQK